MIARAGLPLFVAQVVLAGAACRSRAPSPEPLDDRSAKPPAAAPAETARPPSSVAAAGPPATSPAGGPRPPRGTLLTIVFEGNGQGEIEPCG